jgi:hypothetical protein
MCTAFENHYLLHEPRQSVFRPCTIVHQLQHGQFVQIIHTVNLFNGLRAVCHLSSSLFPLPSSTNKALNINNYCRASRLPVFSLGRACPIAIARCNTTLIAKVMVTQPGTYTRNGPHHPASFFDAIVINRPQNMPAMRKWFWYRSSLWNRWHTNATEQ